MDKIAIRDMVFCGCHGVNDHEKENKQRFSVTVVLWLNLTVAATNDDLNATVNWSTVRKQVKEEVEGGGYALVEALSFRILCRILQNKRVEKVGVTVKKLDAWSDRNGVPSVEMELSQCAVSGAQ